MLDTKRALPEYMHLPEPYLAMHGTRNRALGLHVYVRTRSGERRSGPMRGRRVCTGGGVFEARACTVHSPVGTLSRWYRYAHLVPRVPMECAVFWSPGTHVPRLQGVCSLVSRSRSPEGAAEADSTTSLAGPGGCPPTVAPRASSFLRGPSPRVSVLIKRHGDSEAAGERQRSSTLAWRSSAGNAAPPSAPRAGTNSTREAGAQYSAGTRAGANR